MSEKAAFDEFQSCRFELGEISCAICGSPTDDIGTCEDITLCCSCRYDLAEMSSQAEVSQIMIRIIEGGGKPFEPRRRRMHFKTASGTACGRTAPQPVTDDPMKVTCKRCKETA